MLNHVRNPIFFFFSAAIPTLYYTSRRKMSIMKVMYIAILGRQPDLGLAELRRVYQDVEPFSQKSATVSSDYFHLSRLGGTLKAGFVVAEFQGDIKKIYAQISRYYIKKWVDIDHKITLGISAYDYPAKSSDLQRLGLNIKKSLKDHNVSLRLIPNSTPALSTATSHNNKLGLSSNKVELLIVRGKDNKIIVAESIGAQNITAYAKRDQNRPKRDAFVGMLPPKLAQIMVNLAVGNNPPSRDFTLLDPFCGTGVILQEADLMGYGVLGSDLSEKMIAYTHENLSWLAKSHKKSGILIDDIWLKSGDATDTHWPDFDTVATETYLGRPFSAPPSDKSLKEVSDTCEAITSGFLINLSRQLKTGQEFCIAVPAWRQANGNFHFLNIVSTFAECGLERIFVSDRPLLYFREDQVVARHLYILRKT